MSWEIYRCCQRTSYPAISANLFFFYPAFLLLSSCFFFLHSFSFSLRLVFAIRFFFFYSSLLPTFSFSFADSFSRFPRESRRYLAYGSGGRGPSRGQKFVLQRIKARSLPRGRSLVGGPSLYLSLSVRVYVFVWLRTSSKRTEVYSEAATEAPPAPLWQNYAGRVRPRWSDRRAMGLSNDFC